MAIAVIQLPDVPNRILTKKEAAFYCRIPVNKFSRICPVLPLDMGGGIRSYDIRDIDKWIDSLKENKQSDDDDIISRLG